MAEQESIFKFTPEALAKQKERDKLGKNPNPCIRVYGEGPEDRKCKDCSLVYVCETRSGKRFYKCDLRGRPTRGPGTDHRANWPVCGKFKEREGELIVVWLH